MQTFHTVDHKTNLFNTHDIHTHTHTSMSIKTIKTNENVIDIIGKKRGGAAKWSLTIVGAQFGG